MGRRVSEQRTVRRPRRRVIPERPDKGQFFPGEVARMLAIEGIDNQRLRRIYELVRWQRDPSFTLNAGEWVRFDYVDIACTLEVIRISLDRSHLDQDSFRLPLVRIRRACARLRQQHGLSNPLLQSRLDLVGGKVVATIDGTTFEVDTGQRLIREALRHSTDYLQVFHRQATSPELRERIVEARREIEREATGQLVARFVPGAPHLGNDA